MGGLSQKSGRQPALVADYRPRYVPKWVPKSEAEVQRIIEDVERANERPDPFSRSVGLHEAILQIHDKCRGLSSVDVVQHLELDDESVQLLEEMREERRPRGHI